MATAMWCHRECSRICRFPRDCPMFHRVGIQCTWWIRIILSTATNSKIIWFNRIRRTRWIMVLVSRAMDIITEWPTEWITEWVLCRTTEWITEWQMSLPMARPIYIKCIESLKLSRDHLMLQIMNYIYWLHIYWKYMKYEFWERGWIYLESSHSVMWEFALLHWEYVITCDVLFCVLFFCVNIYLNPMSDPLCYGLLFVCCNVYLFCECFVSEQLQHWIGRNPPRSSHGLVYEMMIRCVYTCRVLSWYILKVFLLVIWLCAFSIVLFLYRWSRTRPGQARQWSRPWFQVAIWWWLFWCAQ